MDEQPQDSENRPQKIRRPLDRRTNGPNVKNPPKIRLEKNRENDALQLRLQHFDKF